MRAGVYMRKYCDDEKIDLELLSDLCMLSPSKYKKVPSVCLSVSFVLFVVLWSS
jgi:hypothetical protein